MIMRKVIYGCSNGVASFITQEEMERFTGMWWSPTRTVLLIERVDEEEVERVLVSTKQPPMKYPLAGLLLHFHLSVFTTSREKPG